MYIVCPLLRSFTYPALPGCLLVWRHWVGGDEGGRGGALPGLRKFWGRRCAGHSPRNGGPATPDPRQRFWIVCLFSPPPSRTFSTVALSIPSGQRAFGVRFNGLLLGTISKL